MRLYVIGSGRRKSRRKRMKLGSRFQIGNLAPALRVDAIYISLALVGRSIKWGVGNDNAVASISSRNLRIAGLSMLCARPLKASKSINIFSDMRLSLGFIFRNASLKFS